MFDLSKFKTGNVWIVEKDSAEYFHAQIQRLENEIWELRKEVRAEPKMDLYDTATITYWPGGVDAIKRAPIREVIEKILTHLNLKVDYVDRKPASIELVKIDKKKK